MLQVFSTLQRVVNTDFDNEDRYMMPTYKSLIEKEGFQSEIMDFASMTEASAMTIYYAKLLKRESDIIIKHIHDFANSKSKKNLTTFIEAVFIKACGLKKEFDEKFDWYLTRKNKSPDKNYNGADMVYGILEWSLVSILKEIRSYYKYLLPKNIIEQYDPYYQELREFKSELKEKSDQAFKEYVQKVHRKLNEMSTDKDAIVFLLSEIQLIKSMNLYMRDIEGLKTLLDNSCRREVKFLTVQLDHYKAKQDLIPDHHSSSSDKKVPAETKALPMPKIKTSLTVPQLGYFFGLLQEHGILLFESKAKAIGFATDHFCSGKGEDITSETAYKKSFALTEKHRNELGDMLINLRNEVSRPHSATKQKKSSKK